MAIRLNRIVSIVTYVNNQSIIFYLSRSETERIPVTISSRGGNGNQEPPQCLQQVLFGVAGRSCRESEEF